MTHQIGEGHCCYFVVGHVDLVQISHGTERRAKLGVCELLSCDDKDVLLAKWRHDFLGLCQEAA